MNLILELLIIFIALAFLFLLSLVEGAIAQSSPLTLRMMMERPEVPEPPLLSLVLENKMEVLRPLHFGNLLALITIAILIAHLNLRTWHIGGLLYSFIAVFLMSVVFRQLLPQMLTQNEPEKKLIRLLRIFHPFYRVLHVLALPLSGILRLAGRLHEEVASKEKSESEEVSGEEIQAYLEIGEDEGILQEEDSKLIQSVVEFGNTLVREVMTPRTKIVACEEGATLAELRDIMVQHRHSRIPIYRGDIDHIVGIAHIRRLMAELVKGRESDAISGIVNPVAFVPESKPVSKLLRELQQSGDYAAIVIDEFGGVAGMVTIEDLVEEIIGEIRDEDEARISKIIEEGPGSYVMHATTELSRLEELLGKKFDHLNCSTVAGLIMDYLGRVPSPGEDFELQGIRIRILDSDRKRTHWIRVQLPKKVTAGE